MDPSTAPLATLLPAPGEPPLTPDEILNRFVGYVADQGLELYTAQEEAILELLSGKHLVLSTPTGSGKSLVATALHFKARCEGKVSYYTCPIKALVNEKFFALCEAFGAESVGMSTGDASINKDAPIIVCTAEVLANLALRDPGRPVDYVVMDEFHYYADKERGVAWQIPLLILPHTTFLLMSATLGDTTSIEKSIASVTGREVASVRSAQRPVPLDHEYSEIPLHEQIEKLISTHRYPVYLVNFTQRAAAEQAQNLMSVNFSSKEEKEQIREVLLEARFDTPYGKDFQRFLRHGIGLHHAGLLPKYRLLVERLAQGGMLKVISGTDTLGVGVNIPIRSVLFTQLCKFDGEKTGILSVRDFLQVSGRAGRKGFDERGSVIVQAPEHVIENLRIIEKGKKNQVKKQPPSKGYVHWDRNTYEKLLSRAPEPLESRFQVTHGMLLNLLQAPNPPRGGGYGRLIDLIGKSHESPYLRRKHRRNAKRAFRSLRDGGIVSVVPGEQRLGRFVEVSSALQRDFTLNHTLSLYLLDTLGKLEREREDYALDVLTLVEAILENPMVVLYKQVDKLKGEKVAELKANGVEYEERMAELEKIEWPKPHREFIYATFNAFERDHPWLGEDNIRPKSIAREMVEGYTSFHDYVRDYGLQRSEGVLLRYLGDVYKALVQNVPEAFRNEEVDDVIAMFRAMLRSVDSSLLDEWESLRNPGEVRAPVEVPTLPRRPLPVDHDPRAFAARVRNELHRLLKALAEKRYEEAAACIFQPDGAWTPELLEAELAPYFAEHAAIDLTPRARRPQLTQLTPAEPRTWIARQRILDPEGDEDWMLDCFIDLTLERPDEAPLIALRRIGV